MHSHKLGIEAKGLEVSQTRIGQEVHPRIVYLHLFLFTIVIGMARIYGGMWNLPW